MLEWLLFHLGPFLSEVFSRKDIENMVKEKEVVVAFFGFIDHEFEIF